MLIANLFYTHMGVPVGTIEFILIRSLYGGTRRYYRTHTYSCISDLILVLQSIYLCYGSYTCITEYVLVLQILYLFTDTGVPVGTSELILI